MLTYAEWERCVEDAMEETEFLGGTYEEYLQEKALQYFIDQYEEDYEFCNIPYSFREKELDFN